LTGAIAAYGKALAILTALQQREEFYSIIAQCELSERIVAASRRANIHKAISSGSRGRRQGTDFGVRRTHMDNQVPKYVTQKRAALLLGIPEEELSRISSELELGHTERAGNQKETYFTYEELRQICFLATHRLIGDRF
jgi:hypothetical protein